MQPYLILIRHSAVQIDPAVNSHQWLLSEDGRSRCRAFAQQLHPYQPSRFVTSHEAKAQETGQIMAEILGVCWTAADGLQEHDRTDSPYIASKVDFETAVAQLFIHPTDLVFGRETAVQAAARFTQAVNYEIEAYPQENIAIVSHGTVMALFICQYNRQLNPMQFWQSLTLPCAFILSLPDKQLIQSLYQGT